jgi:outer membrane protein assembly factor BamD
VTAAALRRCAAVALVALLAGCGAHVLPAIHSDAERIRVARELHDRHDCGPAIELLKTYVASGSGSADVDQAVYLLGSCYLQTKEWALGQTEFERLLRDYPESDSAGAASFRLGEALLGQSRPRDFDQEFTVKAIDQWRRFLAEYPGHWLVPQAERKLLEARNRLAMKLVDTGTLYYKLRLWDPARVYFRKAIDEYGDTPAAAAAQRGLALVDARSGKHSQSLGRLKKSESGGRTADGQPRAAQPGP